MVNYCYFLPFAWASKTGGTGAAQTLFPACLRAKLHAPALPVRYSHFTREAVDIQRGRANYPRSRSWLETETAPPWAPRVAFCAQDGRVCFSEALVGFAGSPAVRGPRQALGGVRHLPAPLSPISAELRALNKNARL